MPDEKPTSLRVLIANDRLDRLDLVAAIVVALEHEVVARSVDVREVGALTTRARPDVALVGLGVSSEHALALIDEIVREASCPVIALLSSSDPDYVREAAKHGVFAYIVETTPEQLQSSIEITLRRFGEFVNLRGAFGRRAAIEQAKGILMARHNLTPDAAFEMMRDHSQRNGSKLADLADAIVESHLLLVAPGAEGAGPEG
jgi:response regulator NasT